MQEQRRFQKDAASPKPLEIQHAALDGTRQKRHDGDQCPTNV